MKTRRANFTLVEMLVVVMIIGILAALLLPALQKALATARQSLCLNNQRQIGVAYDMYVSDWQGLLPPPNMQQMSQWHFDNGLEKTFPHFLGQYSGNMDFFAQKYGTAAIIKVFKTSIYFCPDNLLPAASLTMFRGGYGVNPRVPQKYLTGTLPWDSRGYCVRKSTVPQPTKAVMLGARYSDYLVTQPTAANLGTNSGGIDLIRHNSGCNLLFVDGHAGWSDSLKLVTSLTLALRLQ